MRPVNIYLIGGFLGSGKTTLLQNILNWAIDLPSTAVLVNEFGQISVDGILLDAKGTRVVELASGCICCSMRGEFVKSLEEILSKFVPTRIFVETTGVADTSEIIALLRESGILGRAILQKTICVLDSELWQGRDHFGTVFFSQIRSADLVLLNKIDLVDTNQVPVFIEEIAAINPTGMILPTYQCRIDPDILLEEDPPALSSRFDEANLLPQFEVGEKNGPEFMTVLFEDDGCLSETRFRAVIERMPYHIFRIKGIVRFRERGFKLNHVAGRTQWTQLEGLKGTKLVLIGWEIDTDSILSDLNACRETS